MQPTHFHADTRSAPPPRSLRSTPPLFIQRKCACGGTPGLSGECEECRKRRLDGESPVQPKLRIGAPDDRFEREADRVAERVTSGTGGGPVTVQPVGVGAVHRQASEGGVASSGSGVSGVPGPVRTALDASGQPLPDATREHFEARFGHDFRQVRIHTDSRAAAGAASISARAFTRGSQIVFGAGQFSPDSGTGQKLLAHELTHVLQQRGSRAGSVQRRPQDGGVVQRECKEGETEIIVESGDILGKIAEDHGSTVSAIKERNGLENDRIFPDQKLCIPGTTTGGTDQGATETTSEGADEKCSLVVPSDSETQQLAGVIYAEAESTRPKNDEREAIGWSFLNSVNHTQGVCDGTLCTSLKEHQRKFLCKKDKRDLGDTLLGVIKNGSLAYGNSRWNQVMESDQLKSSTDLCQLDPGEQTALDKSIAAATDVKAGNNPVDYIRFNQAKDSPPSDRMVKGKTVGAHTFYSFKEKESEGRCFV